MLSTTRQNCSALKRALNPGTEDIPYTLSTSQLLAGYGDVDGDNISILDLTVDNGTLTDLNNGSWQFIPNQNFNGTVTLNYKITDGTQPIEVSNNFTLTAVNDLPVLPTTASTLTNATEDIAYSLKAADLLEGVTDADSDPLIVSGLSVNRGVLVAMPTLAGQICTENSTYALNTAVLKDAAGQTIKDANDAPIAVQGLTINADGSWSFESAANTSLSIADGITETITVSVDITGADGANTSSTFDITLTGTAQWPHR